MFDTNPSFISPLPDCTLIEVKGVDASAFLHNLLTNNIHHLGLGQYHLSGFCSPKGRLLASFWVSHPQDQMYHLWISSDLASDFTKKLTMYRLRSHVEIHQKTDSVYGQYDTSAMPHTELPSVELPIVHHAGQDFYRRLVASTEPLSCSQYSLWNLLEIRSGIPRITLATKDLFVPQMINFESVGGVDFKKGCYPGQEIVARSQYLGTIKRRLKLGSVSLLDYPLLNLSPGIEVFTENDPEQSCGVIVLAAIDMATNQYVIQVEIKLSYLTQSVYIRTEAYPKVHFTIEDPPYSLLTI